MTEAEELRFEELVERLERIVEQMEDEGLPLEEALAVYQEGVKLARLGHQRLDAAERRLEELTARGERVERSPQDP
ncbi:MAG: exodeoxyribonuclease VII small subunit [Myxococcota bacterium]